MNRASLIACVSVSFLAASVAAQDERPNKPSYGATEEDLPLIDRTPFDRIYLDERNNNAELNVLPLKIDRLPEPRPAGTLEFRFADDPEVPYEVPWNRIDEIKFFEDLLLEEAIELSRQRKYDEAYFYFDRLLQQYPKKDGLGIAYQKHIFEDADWTIQQAQSLRKQNQEADAQKLFQEAFAVIEELIRLNPKNVESPTVSQKLKEVLEELLIGYVEKQQDYESARAFLDQIADSYGDQQKAILDDWHDKLNKLAAEKRKAAQDFAAQNKARAAHEAVRQMMNIYPTVEGGSQLVAEVMREFPLVMVGVSQQARSFDARQLNDWAARRAGLLTHRYLFEYSARGPEGGRYLCPAGSLEFEEATRLVLQVSRTSTRPDVPQTDGFDVAKLLRDAATPGHRTYIPAWSQLMESVSIEDVQKVRIDLRYPHILPEALLQLPLQPIDDGQNSDGLYVVAADQEFENELSYVANPRYSLNVARPQIVERLYGDSHTALTALRRGEIDVIDRVFPADVPRLESSTEITVQRYEMPSVHMLVPAAHNPFMSNEMFRRALPYAINREHILRFELLNNQSISGCEVVTGPFPKGIPTGVYRSDPLAYAYNHRILPRSYLPRLAITLIELAERDIVKPVRERYEATKTDFESLQQLENVDPRRREEAATRFADVQREYNKLRRRPTLVIAHEADEIPRIACQGIAKQLQMAGIECLVLELPPGESVDDDGRWRLFSTDAGVVADLQAGTVPAAISTKLSERKFALSEDVLVEEQDDFWVIRDLQDGRSYTAKLEQDQLHLYVNVDLRYVEVFMWEPLVDARKLLAVDGITPLGTAHTELALRRLDRAVNWSLARRYLFELHSLARRNGTIIPLWQLVEHYAHRKSVQGIGTRLLSLYDNVRDWQISGEYSERLLSANQ